MAVGLLSCYLNLWKKHINLFLKRGCIKVKGCRISLHKSVLTDVFKEYFCRTLCHS